MQTVVATTANIKEVWKYKLGVTKRNATLARWNHIKFSCCFNSKGITWNGHNVSHSFTVKNTDKLHFNTEQETV